MSVVWLFQFRPFLYCIYNGEMEQRIHFVLLFSGIAMASVEAILVAKANPTPQAGLVIVGLQVVLVAGIGLVGSRWPGASDTPQGATAFPPSGKWFRSLALLPLAAFVGITVAAMVKMAPTTSVITRDKSSWLVKLTDTAVSLFEIGPLWIPLVALAYAMGRRSISIGFLIGFSAMEIAAVVVNHLANRP